MTARKANTTTEAPAEVTTEEITYSAKELAAMAGCSDPKTFRRFLRSRFPREVKGERWEFSPAFADTVIAAYQAKGATEVDAPESE